MKIHPVGTEFFHVDTHLPYKILESSVSLTPIILKVIKNTPYVRQKNTHSLDCVFLLFPGRFVLCLFSAQVPLKCWWPSTKVHGVRYQKHAKLRRWYLINNNARAFVLKFKHGGKAVLLVWCSLCWNISLIKLILHSPLPGKCRVSIIETKCKENGLCHRGNCNVIND